MDEKLIALIAQNHHAAWLDDQSFGKLLKEVFSISPRHNPYDLALKLVIIQRLASIEASLNKIATTGLP